MSYRAIQTAIEGVFGSSGWTAHNIEAFPSNYENNTNNNEFVIVKIFHNQSARYGFNQTLKRGQLMVRIFTQAGLGERRVNEIGDILDGLFENQTLSSRLYMDTSNLGNHSMEDGYYQAHYNVNFVFY